MEIVLIKIDNGMYIGTLKDKWLEWETINKPYFVYAGEIEEAYKLTASDFPVYVDNVKFTSCSNITKLDIKELNYIKLVNKKLYNKIMTKYEIKRKSLTRKSFKYEFPGVK